MIEPISSTQDPIFDRLIKPAVLKLFSETEGCYRCERELHHHFTICLEHIKPLRLGTHQKVAWMEGPAEACYGSGRKGNLDYFIPANPGAQRGHGAAIELNYNYEELEKIVRDFKKLIDPKNGYTESTYFAYGTNTRFFKQIKAGLEGAFAYFSARYPDFELSPGLNVVVFCDDFRSANRLLWLGSVPKKCGPSGLHWIETVTPKERSATEATINMQRKTTVEKAWFFWAGKNKERHFLAFVNQKRSCTVRSFDAETGIFLGKQNERGKDYQAGFRDYFTSGIRLVLSKQPSLEQECKERLPDSILSELRGQIPNLSES
jgi:hypothetical protein